MTATLDRKIGKRMVHRRRHIKADGRDLLLYGYAPHTLPVLGESDDPVA